MSGFDVMGLTLCVRQALGPGAQCLPWRALLSPLRQACRHLVPLTLCSFNQLYMNFCSCCSILQDRNPSQSTHVFHPGQFDLPLFQQENWQLRVLEHFHCLQAAILTGRRGKTAMSLSEIDDSVDRIVAGMEGTPMVDSKSKALVAYHEVGHAICGTLTPGGSHKAASLQDCDSSSAGDLSILSRVMFATPVLDLFCSMELGCMVSYVSQPWQDFLTVTGRTSGAQKPLGHLLMFTSVPIWQQAVQSRASSSRPVGLIVDGDCWLRLVSSSLL